MAESLEGKTDRCVKAGIWGSIIAAICCFTPILAFAIGLIGFSILTPYLDYALFPLFVFFILLTFYGWAKAGNVFTPRRKS